MSCNDPDAVTPAPPASDPTPAAARAEENWFRGDATNGGEVRGQLIRQYGSYSAAQRAMAAMCAAEYRGGLEGGYESR